MIYVKADGYKGTYLTVWEITEKNGFVKGRVSSSAKKQDETYENSNWFVDFGKNCKDKALTLKEKDRIMMKDFSMKNVYNAESKKSFLNFSIYSFDIVEPKSDSETERAPQKTTKFPNGEPPIKSMDVKEESDDLPFDL